MKDMTYFRFKFKFVIFLVLSGEDVNSFSVGQSFVGNKKHTMPLTSTLNFDVGNSKQGIILYCKLPFKRLI